jgi:hypothetical protein
MLYPEGGKFHVSLAIPGQQSKICKAIGITASANFLIPTIEYIIRCAVEGDLGIADTIKKNKAVQYLNKCSSPQTLKQFSKSFGVTIEGDPEQYRKNGRYNIPASAVSLSTISDSGLKMIEKATIKSILEQYKPWIEIAKLMTQHLVQIEDIIARTSGLLAPSEKPKGNAGNSKRPKALGYNGASEMKKSIGKMESLAKKKPGFYEKSKQQNQSRTQSGATFSGIQTSNDYPTSSSYEYKIVSTVYSTGVFKEGIDYEYQYIDIPDDEKIGSNDLDDSFGAIDIDDNDPYKNKKPKTIIFGIYDSKGNPINPEDPIRIPKYNPDGSLSMNQGQVEFIGNLDVGGEDGIQTISKADWLTRTGRWFGHFNRKGVTYLWRHKNNKNIKAAGTNPQIYNNGWVDGPYEQLFYKDPKNLEVNREKNIIEGDNISVDSQYIGTLSEGGNPEAPVYYFTSGEQDLYKEIFADIVDRKFAKATELTSEEKATYKAEIMSNVDTQSHLESVSNYGFLSSIFKNGVTNPPINKGLTGGVISTGLPSNLKNSFMPKKIRFNNEDIWIDPESDYEMKIIKVDASPKIKFSDNTTNGPQEFEAEILRFVKNSIEIKIDNGSTFDVDIIRNTNASPSTLWQPYVAFQTAIPGRYEGLSQFTIDNWNYKDSDNNPTTADEVKFNNMSMLLRITGTTPPPFWSSKIVTSSAGSLNNDNTNTISGFHKWTNGGNYILGIVDGNWKIGRYEESINAVQSLASWNTQAVTIDINDSVVSRVKVRNIGTEIFDTDIIVEWYYNNKWNFVPPSTWQITPDFNSPNTIIDYNIITSPIQEDFIGDVGQILTSEVINYNISGYKYSNKISTTQPSFGLTESDTSGKFIQRYKLSIKRKVIKREFKTIQFENDKPEFVNLNLTFGSQVGKFKLDDGTYAYFNKTNYRLIKWEYLFFDSTKSSFLNGETGRKTSTNVDRLPINIGEKRNWIINYSKIGNNTNDTPLVTTSITIPPNQIRLKEPDNPFGRLLDPRKITNRHLAEDNPLINKYSNGMYGHSEPENKQTIEQIYRYMKSEFDVETYYIVEGILAEDNTTGDTPSSDAGSSSSAPVSGGGGGYYNKPHALGAIKVFISVLSDIFSKLIPAIKRLISLFKNPANFIVEIIKEKLGETTKIFSPQFINDYQQMISLPKMKRREFVRSSSLRDYVYVNPIDGEHRVLFDGAAIKKLGPLFGSTLRFGIEVKKALPKLIFKIDLAKMTSDSLYSILKGTARNNNISIINGNTNTSSNQPNSTTPSSSGNKADPNLSGDEITITYSTGKYIEGVQYQYIYVTEYVSRLIKEGDDLAESNDPEQMNLAFAKYDEALRSDPNNDFIKDRISNLMNKIPNYVQPIMEFLLSLVSGPLKLVADVVQFIMDFFTKLKIHKLPVDVPKFLSFAWLIKEGEYGWSNLKGGFFSPGAIFKTFGLDVLPISITGITPPDWTQAAGIFATYLSGAIPDMPKLNKNTIPPGMPVVNQPPGPLSNFNNAMSLAFLPFMKKPTVDKTVFPVGASNVSKHHLLTWFKKNPRIDYQKFKLIGTPPILEFTMQFICFIEAIINSAIDIFWSILGLEVLIPPPHINLCKKFKGNMSPKDIMDLLNGNYKDSLKSEDSTDANYDFIYDIKTSDGKSLRDLDREELQRWLDDNRDYEFEFLY